MLEGPLGRAVIKTSAVAPDRHTIEAPARVFHSQEELHVAFRNGELNRDFVAVLRFQGPKAIGMPELHKLMPPLGVLQDRGHRVALVTDGRLSGASGKVPSAIHVTPEAAAGGAIAKIRNGDVIRLDASAGRLDVLVADDVWAQRPHAEADLSGSHIGMGREMFGVFRGAVGSADEGAAIFPAVVTVRKQSGVQAFFIFGERNGPLVSRPERALMSSRLWLAVAFVLAAGASPARAETRTIAVTLDQAKVARLPHGTATLIVGNPMIADVTMLKNNNTMVITGKGFGQTNLIAIDGDGSLIEEQQIQVLPAKTVLVLQSGKLQDLLRLQSCLHADGSTRRRRQDLQGHRRTDLDPQRLRFEQLKRRNTRSRALERIAALGSGVCGRRSLTASPHRARLKRAGVIRRS